MKENFGEKHRLPLSFKRMEYAERTDKKTNKNILYILKSEQYQSSFYVREKPVKPLIRLL